MPEAPKQPITTRLDAQILKLVDCTVQRLAEENPDWPYVTRSDAIRALIVAGSASIATPIATTMPPEKQRSG